MAYPNWVIASRTTVFVLLCGAKTRCSLLCLGCAKMAFCVSENKRPRIVSSVLALSWHINSVPFCGNEKENEKQCVLVPRKCISMSSVSESSLSARSATFAKSMWTYSRAMGCSYEDLQGLTFLGLNKMKPNKLAQAL